MKQWPRLSLFLFYFAYCLWFKGFTCLVIEGVCGIRSQVTFDAMSNSRSHSQLNTRKFGRRIW